MRSGISPVRPAPTGWPNHLRSALHAAGLGFRPGLDVPAIPRTHGWSDASRRAGAALSVAAGGRRPVGAVPRADTANHGVTSTQRPDLVAGWTARSGRYLAVADRPPRDRRGARRPTRRPLTIWGRLEPGWIVVTHYLLTAFVAYAPQRPVFRPSPAEVAEVIEMPLALIIDPASLAEEIWELQGGPRQVSFYRHGEHKVWERHGPHPEPGGEPARSSPGPARPACIRPVGPAGAGQRRLAPGDVWPRTSRQPSA